MRKRCHTGCFSVDRGGYSLLELIITVSIIGIIIGATSFTFMRAYPNYKLDNAAQNIAATLQLARNKAISEGNNWFVQFNLDAGEYYLVDDDGYVGDGSFRHYNPTNPYFNKDRLNNSKIDDNEIYRGPIKLPGGVYFLDDGFHKTYHKWIFNSRNEIFFQKEEGSPIRTYSYQRVDEGVWLVNQYYQENVEEQWNKTNRRHIIVGRNGVEVKRE